MLKDRVFQSLFVFMFVFLSLASLKIGFVRVGQLVILILFVCVLLDDFQKNEIDFSILFFFLFGGVLVSLVSLNSVYPKIGESKFLLKYLVVYPSAFYVGARFLQKLKPKQVISIIEYVVVFYIAVAFLVEFELFPKFLDGLLMYRDDHFGGELYLDFQGTFNESGVLAQVVYLMVVSSFLLRVEFDEVKNSKWWLVGFYSLVFVSLVLTKNKTVWIALIMMVVFLIFLKVVFTLMYSNQYQLLKGIKSSKTLKIFDKVDATKLFLLLVFLVVSLVVINGLMSEPIISESMLQKKLNHERGKAFLYVMKLLDESSYLGGYGFGYIEYYFSHLQTSIIGLGKGVGMVFNSFLDVWVSAGLIGLFFHLFMYVLSFSKEHFLCIVVPMTLFVYNNFNPFIGYEYHFVFLGLSYGLKRYKLT